jgi:predicted MFS family arabinose efflux permease
VRRAPHLTLLVLSLVYMCNAIDRNVLTVLMEPIKHAFTLSDSRLGLLATGFGVSYAVSGLVFGIAADRTNRRNLIAGCLTFWSGATALCGAAGSFLLLFLARLGVGIGEAGASPAAMSMIADLYPAGRRGTAMSVYYLSTSIGFMIALALGGLVERYLGWRATFLIAAIPGALLIPILLFGIREPVRGALDHADSSGSPPSIAAFARFVLAQPALILLVIGATINVTSLAGVGAWTVSYFVRTHGVSIATAGAVVGGAQGLAGIAGTLAGGILGDALGRRDVRARLWVVSAAMLVGLACTLGWIAAPNFHIAAILFAATAFAHSFWYGPVYSLGQELVRVRMRATMAAMLYLISNLGAGAGPAIIGYLSDRYGGLGPALVSVAAINAVGAIVFFFAATRLAAGLERAGT